MPIQKQLEISLARRAAAGDGEAFSALAESIRTRLARYSRMVCRQPEDAEEVVQDTLLQVFQRIGELREPEVVHAWVFRIALNQCRMKRRRGVHDPEEWQSLEGCREQTSLAEIGPSPEELLLATESSHAMDEVILALPESYREVVMLRCLEGLSTEETAAVLETSVDVVRARLHRARSAMRSRIAP